MPSWPHYSSSDLCVRNTLHDLSVHIGGKPLNALAQVFYETSQLRVLLEQLEQLPGLLCGKYLALLDSAFSENQSSPKTEPR